MINMKKLRVLIGCEYSGAVRECGYWDNQTPSGQNKLGPSKDRWKIRSATYPGIASAMASQWSNFLTTK